MSEPFDAAKGLCPNCHKPSGDKFRPFCSKRCADIDLGRWFSGTYAIPTAERDDPDGNDDDENSLTQG
jgi:uncharacterized protein